MRGRVATCTGMPVKMIDFTAKWCGPCRQMEPVLASVVKEYAAQGVELVAIDVDDDPIEAQRFGVRSMPTLVFVRDGREVGRIVGSRPRAFVAGVLDRVIQGEVAVSAP
jgi:thioredoxin 1